MGRIVATVVFLFVSCCLFSQGVGDKWVNMPDSLFPYLDRGMRAELLRVYAIEGACDGDEAVGTGVVNGFGGECRVETLTMSYMRMVLSRGAEVELKLLPCTVGSNSVDSVICISLTLFGECPESVVLLYSSDWEFLSELKVQGAGGDGQEPLVWQAHLSADADELVVSSSLLFEGLWGASGRKRESRSGGVVQKKLKWTGDSFN